MRREVARFLCQLLLHVERRVFSAYHIIELLSLLSFTATSVTRAAARVYFLLEAVLDGRLLRLKESVAEWVRARLPNVRYY